jgi:hypothetical protein
MTYSTISSPSSNERAWRHGGSQVLGAGLGVLENLSHETNSASAAWAVTASLSSAGQVSGLGNDSPGTMPSATGATERRQSEYATA